MTVKRRQIPTITRSGTDVRTEIFGGLPIKYIIMNSTAAYEFAVEINGIEIVNYTIADLTKENGIRYGFDASTQNAGLAILSFEDEHFTDIVNTGAIRQLTFIAKTNGTYDLTVVEVIG